MIVHGAQINFGIGNVVQHINGIVQTREHHVLADSEEIKDGGESTTSKAYWDFKEECTFTYIADGFNGQIDSNALPIIGLFVTINRISNLGSGNTTYQPVAGNTWIVEDVIVNSSNTSATRVTLKLARYPYINA